MHQEFLMGNEAIAKGALACGVNLVCGYPGTPSTEVLEAVSKFRSQETYVEWSVNEKAATELAGGASFAGARTLVTMKQMGLNVAGDPLMCLSYIGVKGGMVVLVADDPGPISSQTEQDSRTYAEFAKVPCFDPSSAQEAYQMMLEAYSLSEKLQTPVLMRSTTRVCHSYATVEVLDQNEIQPHTVSGFIRDPSRFVIFPRLSYQNHGKIEARNAKLSEEFSASPFNTLETGEKGLRRGVACGGISYTYVLEARKKLCDMPLLKIGTAFPFPEQLAVSFLRELDEVLVVEELDPYIERELLKVCGKHHLSVRIRGKLTGDMPTAGENTRDSVLQSVSSFIGFACENDEQPAEMPNLPVRPPVLCAGCPHRASFYAVKQAMKGQKTIFCGDIGCYTLGNAMPLDMVDTCLCMGAGVNIAQGVYHMESDTRCFAFVGDSTFFASAITGVVNAVYNQAEMTLVVLDNSTTAMTGHQPHPGTGRTMMGEIVEKVSIEAILKGCGVSCVETVNPFETGRAIETVKRVSALSGVKAIIFKAPCIAMIKPAETCCVSTQQCIGCRKCIRDLGCPALVLREGKPIIEKSMCTGCGLCAQVCPVQAIKKGAL